VARLQISRKSQGRPIEVGALDARGFLHSDLPSWRNEVGIDRNTAAETGIAPSP
jgi:hypothetical protein